MARGALWLGQVLAGPAIWAVTFAAVYALHGTGCAQGWDAMATPVGSVHRLAMALAWGAGLLACGGLLLRFSGTETRWQALPRMGAWIGLGATLFSLFPLIVLPAC
ncbi:MAG: hypothetical protein JJT95_14690 [Pararhodobacter sp.]|nr:hypothetical protein [Pararhodobacter sp.]